MVIKAIMTASLELNVFVVLILYKPVRNMETTGNNRDSVNSLQDATLSS